MVPRKTWVSENFGRISKSRKRFWWVSKSRFFMVCFYFFESRKFSPKGLGLRFLTRVLASLGFYYWPPLLLKVVGNLWKLPGLFQESPSWQGKNLMHLTQKKLAGIHSLYTSQSSPVWICDSIQYLAKMFWICLNIAKIVLEASEQKIFGHCGRLEHCQRWTLCYQFINSKIMVYPL